jgi:N,N-dimethylformamidase beta subunit-like, C-terminal/Domain of unknown function (DUF4082)/Fibronectin type III domain/Bacterial Ig domain
VLRLSSLSRLSLPSPPEPPRPGDKPHPATPRRRRGGRWRLGVVAVGAAAIAAMLPAGRSAAATDPCGPPVASAIACENTNAGDPESDWMVTGSGDANLQGFATAMSVNAGETESFKITTSVASYHIDILRMGYYQGRGARKLVSAMRPAVSPPQNQPACQTEPATGLIDCGNWAVSASWAVPAGAVSGVYLAHLVRDDTGGGSLIPFVVRNDGRHSDLVVQTSDETWQAYNSYGGNSLYQCTGSLCPPGSPRGYKGAFKVSYNRPFHTAADDSGRSWVLYAEYPMLRFLEANGYDVSYVSGLDVATRGSLLLDHKVFLSVGHDEYWSGAQRSNVEAARAAGVNLAFFSGNEMFWKTRWEPSLGSNPTPNRTLVSYKETHFDGVADPQDPPTSTATWRDPRFGAPADGGRPENAVTGQFFIVNSGTTDITVPAQYSGLRFWRNTPVAALTGNQSVTLGAGAGTLGYEWDEDADNGFRPAGLVDMSATTDTAAEVFTDYGTTTASGRTATHHLTLYRYGASLVFGAGTVQWSWGLDADNPVNHAADRTMQQATVNLFADMGAQPFTPLAGLVTSGPSTDTTPPVSTITSPAPGAGLADGARVTITGTASDSGGGVVAGVEVSTDGGSTWHPATGTTTWTYSWVVHGSPTATLLTRAADDSGNLGAPSQIGVSVACPCSIWGPNVTPMLADAGDPQSVEVGLRFRSDTFGTITGLRFYKSTRNTGAHVGNLWTATGQLLARATFTNETATGWQQVNFPSPVAVTANTTYVASYYAPVGHYAQDSGYMFAAPSPEPDGNGSLDSPPLHGLRTTATVGNGLYSYGTGTHFPTNTFDGENYWVDPIFAPAVPPGQVTGVVATAGYASAGLTWTAPTTGGPVTSYVVTPYAGTAAQPATTLTGTPPATSASITGLSNGTAYTFTVTAGNGSGDGPPSAPSAPVTPSASASIVLNGGFETGLAAWTPSGVAAPVASTARAHSGTGSALLGTASGTEPLGESTLTQTVAVPATGTSGLSFWYWPTTTDALCTGAACVWDWEEVQVRTTAGVTLATILKGNSDARAWTQVSFDLTPWAGQQVVLWFNVHQDGASPPDDTSIYLDDVAVTNSQPTAPAAPTGVTALAGSGSAAVSWTAPSSGGSPVTGYTVTPFAGTTALPPVVVTGSPPATGTTVAGLTNGTAYTFTVAATNALGTGPASAPSNPVTPGVGPPPPAFVQAVTAHGLDRAALTATPAATVTAGNRLIVEVGIWSSGHATAAAVTDSAGNAYTEVLHFVAADGTEQSVWTAPVTAGGGTRPTVTVQPTAVADVGFAVAEYSGLSTAAGTAAVDQTAQASGATGAPATVASGATPATTGAGELAIGCYADSGFGTAPAAGSGWTLRTRITGASDMDLLFEDSVVPGGAAPNATASTGGNTTWLMSTVVFRHA